jgi:sodium/hydrogen exchanger 8
MIVNYYYHDCNSNRHFIADLSLIFYFLTYFPLFVSSLSSSSYFFRTLYDYPRMETALLFLFCYSCYASAEAMGLSGIMALFFNGVCLAHYNSYNLSDTSHIAAEQIFATLSVLSETLVFLFMGLGVFTGRYKTWDFGFAFLALLFCLIARAANIFPLSFASNMCRQPSRKIPPKMQVVLWFVGLRGAIAFALAENMPGPNKDTYITTTLLICLFTTIVCGGMTEGVLTKFGMKQMNSVDIHNTHNPYEQLVVPSNGSGGGSGSRKDSSAGGENGIGGVRRSSRGGGDRKNRYVEDDFMGIKGAFKRLDSDYLKPFFGGNNDGRNDRNEGSSRNDVEIAEWRSDNMRGGGGGGGGGGLTELDGGGDDDIDDYIDDRNRDRDDGGVSSDNDSDREVERATTTILN